MLSLSAALAAALLSLLLDKFAGTRAGVGAPSVGAGKDEMTVAGRAADHAHDRFGNVLDGVWTAAHECRSKQPFAREFEMAEWLKKQKCVATWTRELASETARGCSNTCDRLWFGWSDDTAGFLNSLSQSSHIARNFPLMVSLNRNGWALLNANAFELPYSSLGCAVNPIPKRPQPWTYAQRWMEYLGAKGVLQLATEAERYIERVHVEFADWTGAMRRPMGSKIDGATRAELVASILQSPKVRALTISWTPHPTQIVRRQAPSLRAVARALAHSQCGIQYLAVYDQHVLGNAVGPIQSKGLLSALYIFKGDDRHWRTLSELSVSLQSFGLGDDDDERPITNDLSGLIVGMPNLRHINIHMNAKGRRPTNSATRRLESIRRRVASLSFSTVDAFVGIASAKHLQPVEHFGRALLVSVPWYNGSLSDPDGGQRGRCDLELVDQGLLCETAALTLFVKRSSFMLEGHKLGADIARFLGIRRLAIDGWWSVADVNHVLLQMEPRLPTDVRYLLIRPVSLLLGRAASETMAVLCGMLVNSRVAELALTVILPCDALDNWSDPFADQLVDALVRMRHLAQLDLVLYTCAAPEATDAAGIVAMRVQAARHFARVTHLTWEKSWTEMRCRSNEKFPSFDALSELSTKLRNVARCTPPDNRFPMPHHFSGAFNYSSFGTWTRVSV